MVNAMQLYQQYRGNDQDMALRQEASSRQGEAQGLQNQMLRFQFAQAQEQAARERHRQNMLAQAAASGNPNALMMADPKLGMQMQLGQQRIQAQREAAGSRERMMREAMEARERSARERGNKPIWDATRGVFVQPPGASNVAGSVISPPGLPKTQKQTEQENERQKTLETYAAARDGLISGLSDTSTGPFVGMAPAMTTKQQIGEGAVAAMAPVLKQIFRIAGEGTFTDKDQETLMKMVPTRNDRPDAIKSKMENIDRIISAKMGAPIPKKGGAGGGFDDPAKEERYQKWKAGQEKK